MTVAPWSRLLDTLKIRQRGTLDENIWFFVILTGLLLLAGTSVIQPAPRLLAFWVLLLTHIGLHWLAVSVPPRRAAQTLYLMGQGAVVTLLVVLSLSPVITLTAFTVLMAVSIGVFGLTRRVGITVLAYIGLMLACFWSLGGEALLTAWLQPISLNLVLVLVFMGLYRRQLEARDHAQTLLAQLEQANHQLAAYSEQIEDITLTKERERMARELHDTLAQGLAGLILQMEAIADHLKNGRLERSEAILRQAMIRARTTLTETRGAIDDLRGDGANGLLSQRLHAKIKSLLVAASLISHLDIDLPTSVTVPPAIADHALHIVGELLHNVVRHARASTLWVTVKVTDKLDLSVRDDGIGFSPTTSPISGHYGLQGVRERTALVAGELHIESQPNAGTLIRVRLPLEGK